jgi:hypothetical protein
MNNTIEVIRGIPAFIVSRDYVKRGIVTPQNIYNISKVYTKTYSLSKKDNLLGVVVGKEFNICYCIKLENGETMFGYFVSHDDNGNYRVQPIDGFNKFTYNPYKTQYCLGRETCIQQDEIKDIVYKYKDLFYSEFK